MIVYALTRSHRLRLARAFWRVPRVDLAIDCALEDQMGQVWVDDLDEPGVFVIQSGPFLYLSGDPAGAASQAALDLLAPSIWLMPSAAGWLEAAQARYADRLEPIERYSFSSEALSVERLDSLRRASRYGEQVQPLDAGLVEQLWGVDQFVDLSAYSSPRDYFERGFGFGVMRGRRAIGAAYATLVCSRGIEISVYVEEDYRRQGMATALAARLVQESLERRIDPHWDAANPKSAALAQKLGYRPAGSYLAYLRTG